MVSRRFGVAMTPAVLLFVLSQSCSDASSSSLAPSNDPSADLKRAKVATVTVTLDSTTLAPTHSAHATAVAKDASGNVLSGLTVSWTSTNTAVATVSSTGGVLAVGAGSAAIQATVQSVTAGAALAVKAVATATQLAIVTQPGNGASGSALSVQPVIQLRDANNTLVSSSTAAVSAHIASGVGTLSGTATVNAVNGVATFTKLAIVGTGSFTIQFTSSGLASATSTTVTVTAPPSLLEDFSSYTSTSNMVSNPRGIYNPVEEIYSNPYGGMVLDQTVGFSGSTQTMRYDNTDASALGGTGNSGRCTNPGGSVWRALKAPTNARQIWVEYWIKFSTNFSFGGSPTWGCTSAPETKLFIDGVYPYVSRFNLEVTNGQWVWGYPDNETAFVLNSSTCPTCPPPSSMFDGKWHQIRLAVGLSSATGVADGMARFWLDGRLMADGANVVVNRTSFTNFWVGQTRNQYAGANMSMWWGKVSMWTSNPGW